ncbi:MAG TPA: D-cysteine desulfhydrase family protein [Blastocatellia bacterium]|nr:D-cysteine desulfhydrase family protein [Blastocatellia bacterium]
MNVRSAAEKLRSFPRLDFGHYPTPIEEMPRLRAALGGGPRLLVKRDDYTGPGFGGNKVRKLEYYLARAQADGAEAVITMGGEKSNHCRVTAALCARLGLRCLLVLNPAAVSYPSLKPASLALDELFGAEIHRVGNRQERITTAQALAEKLRREGVRVCEIPLGASTPLGALGFVSAIGETAAQLNATSERVDYIFHSSSSGGTQAGIVAGCQIFGLEDIRVIGVSPDDPSASISAEVGGIIRGIGEIFGLPEGSLRDEVTVLDEFIGPGYGISTPESEAAIELVARTEGIILDPVYTAKAMAALIDWISKGKLTDKDTVLFWHTGGQLAMFYRPVED